MSSDKAKVSGAGQKRVSARIAKETRAQKRKPVKDRQSPQQIARIAFELEREKRLGPMGGLLPKKRK